MARKTSKKVPVGPALPDRLYIYAERDGDSVYYLASEEPDVNSKGEPTLLGIYDKRGEVLATRQVVTESVK